MVVDPTANQRTESELVEFASVMAKTNDGVVEAIHVVTVRDRRVARVPHRQIDRHGRRSEPRVAIVRVRP